MVRSWRTVTGAASGPAWASAPRSAAISPERCVDVEAPLVAQRQDDHGDEALGHRADAERRVGVGCGTRLEVAHAAAAGVHELAVERDAVGDAGRAQLGERLGEERVDGRGGGAHARGALGIGEALVHVGGTLVTWPRAVGRSALRNAIRRQCAFRGATL